ncbi:unnamed protein product [Psylliodes chrysocephalus]|uniref:Uncharacterized protein n=1 Tax=Psylliodes chrysocephalus TaxID=3402493 RepID=A0A9P0GLL4_9CUCU|nr:unnamed protein product [Psylliodes chrysocephala]
MFDPLSIQEKPRLYEWNTIPKPKTYECDPKFEKFRRSRKPPKGPGPITWTVSDISKAGCLLNSPPVHTSFEDEQEMRRVYSLIYDVFRYKYVLTQALNDINFFGIFPKLSANEAVVWLLFYDLYHRNFNKREISLASLVAQLFDAYGFSFPDNALWSQKVKLAAAVARLRIKNNALSLSEMLPPHLKDEKVTEHAQTNPVTCWINLHKTKDGFTLCHEIERSFGLRLVNDVNQLNPHTFKWDKHCPQTIVFHASMRPLLAKSRFIKEYNMIVQDKSFCLGPATFKKLLTDLELTGTVIQTHVNSPRSTAYLATLLSQNEKIKKLLAFSAGKRKEEYELYFNELGMSNIRLFSDRLIDTAPDAHYMEEVVAVFATPPNSYSAVVDPIDLVCSRGGDLSMLEILTETGDSKEARERIAAILEEQQKTLRFAMSRPQIQFVLYETHSELEAENSCMVSMTLKEINKIAKLHHATLQGKLCVPHPSENIIEDKEVNNNEENIGDSILTTPSRVTILSEMTDEQEKFLDSIKVPDTDIFDNSTLPLLCDNENCRGFACPGCYLALLKRKKVIRLDDKYMIQMAEQRGLFGSQSNALNVKSKPSRVVRKKIEKDEKQSNTGKRFRESEIGRIAAPTFAFLRQAKSIPDLRTCPKSDCNPTQRNVYKCWWKETTRHINGLKKSLIRQKLIPPDQTVSNSKSAVNCFIKRSSTSVDEVIRQKNMASKIPIYPRLKLMRSKVFEKNQVPVAVTHLSFPTYTNIVMMSI